jgi:cation diffusion facilitator CzcD-associated flavoprotein CzcO
VSVLATLSDGVSDVATAVCIGQTTPPSAKDRARVLRCRHARTGRGAGVWGGHPSGWFGVELAGKRVAVVGTGCSAIQVVPAIQPFVEHLDVYQRTPGWTIPRGDFAYRERTLRLFERVPALQRLDRSATFAFMELVAAATTSRPWLLGPFRTLARRQIKRAIKDPELRRKVAPRDELGCKRVMITDDWYPTLTKANVELVTDPVVEVTPTGIRTEDGTERPAEVLVLATGFKMHPYVPPMEIAGVGGRTLAEEWAEFPRAYLGLTVPDFPNMFLLFGPNTGVGGGSIIYMIEAGMGHVITALEELERTGARRIEINREARRGVRSRAALRPRWNRLAQRLRELLPRREWQQPEHVALAVQHLSAQDRPPPARRVPTRRAGE